MSIGKKELRLIGILCFVAYILTFYKVVWQSVIPSINSVQTDLDASLEKKRLLDEDYDNINAYKTKLMTLTTSNERIDEYLMSSANMVDSLEYVDKLTRLIGDDIREINISRPEQKYMVSGDDSTAAGTNMNSADGSEGVYYEIKMDFRAYMSYSEALELIKYVEGGTRRAKITKFFVKALSENDLKKSIVPQNTVQQNTVQQNTVPQNLVQQNTVQQNAASGNIGLSTSAQAIQVDDRIFDTNITISLYAINLRSSDRMYEYSRHKLNRFIYTNGIFLTTPDSDVSLSSPSPEVYLGEEFAGSDIIISEKSYLAAGENLQVFGVDRSDNIIRLKTNSAAEVQLRLIGKSYFVDTFENGRKSLSMTGSLPDRDTITLAVAVDMPDIAENEKIRLNVKVTNNSGKDLNITLKDQQNRVSIYDRNGNRIYGNSTVENVKVA